MISQTEENYLKTIFKITEREGKSASTNTVAAAMSTTAASVTDMFNRLKAKNLVNYEKAKGVTLTTEGGRLATSLIRKHRIWEVFLCEKLGYSWDECHDLAEDLEHIQDEELINRLERFLGHPKFDPHGDPIPDSAGNFAKRTQVILSDMKPGEKGVIVGRPEIRVSNICSWPRRSAWRWCRLGRPATIRTTTRSIPSCRARSC